MTTKEQQIANLKSQLRNVQALQYNAAQIRDAKSFGRLNVEFESIVKQLDTLRKSN